MTDYKNKLKDISPYINLLSQIGLVMITSILIGFFIGYMIGMAMNFETIGLILGTLTGVFLGFWIVYKLCLKKM